MFNLIGRQGKLGSKLLASLPLMLMSLTTGIALAQSPRLSQVLGALAPWALLMTLLFAAGIWLVFQPMQMRGTLEM